MDGGAFAVPARAADARRYDPTSRTAPQGDTMGRTTTAVLACLLLAGGLLGCSSSGDDTAESKPTTVTTTVTATPSLSQADAKRQCSLDIAEAAPGWEDWSYSPGDWQNDPRTPEVCQSLADEVDPPSGNRAFMDALIDGLEMADDPRADQ